MEIQKMPLNEQVPNQEPHGIKEQKSLSQHNMVVVEGTTLA
jgi:hypothetical protein